MYDRVSVKDKNSVEMLEDQPLLRELIDTMTIEVCWCVFAYDTIVSEDIVIENDTKVEL
jgi:hypothetical protein